MLNLLRFVTFPQFRKHTLRTILTVVGIALGVAVIIAMRLVNASIFGSVRESIDDVTGKAVLSIANGGAGLPEEILDRVKKVPGVRRATAVILDSGLVLASKQAGERLQILGVDYLADQDVRSYEFDDENLEMEDPVVVLSQPDSIFVTQSFAAAHGLKLGSPLRLQTVTGPKDLVVRGILKETGPARAYGGMLALMDLYAAQIAFGKGTRDAPGRFDQIDVVLEPGVSIAEAQDRIAAAVEGFAAVGRPESRGKQIEGMLSALRFSFAQSQLLAFILGIFLIYNTMNIAVVQRRREIGILRSLGTTAGQIRGLFLLEATVLGAVGSALGILLGWQMARTLVPLTGKILKTLLARTSIEHLAPSAESIVIGFLGGLLFTLLATLVPASQAGGVSPMVILRKDAAVATSRLHVRRLAWIGLALVLASIVAMLSQYIRPSNALGLVAMATRLVGVALLIPLFVIVSMRTLRPGLGRLFGIRGKLAGDNLVNAPGRTAVTITAVMLGISAYLIVGTIMESLDHSVNSWIDKYMGADLTVTASSRMAGPQSNRIPAELIEGIQGIPGVKASKAFRFIEVSYGGEMTGLVSHDIARHRRYGSYQMVDGPSATAFMEAMERGEGIGVSEAFAIHYKKKVGDTVTLDTPTGKHAFPILGTFVDFSGTTGSMHIDRALYRRYWLDPLADGIDILLEDRSRKQEVAAAIREAYGVQYDLQVLTNDEIKQVIRGQVVQGFALSRATEAVVMLIAAFGIVNTLLAAVLDRTREIGILRALGATRRQVAGAVLLEAGLMGALGVVLGAVLGFANSYPFIKTTMIRTVGWHLDYHPAYGAVLAACALTVLISMAAGYYPARRASRLDILEAIQYE